MMDGDDRGRGEAVPVDGTAALEALAECLRFLACGYGPDPRERGACLALLVSDRGAGWRNPSGTVSVAHTRSPDVRVQSLPVRQNKLAAWQSGGIHARHLGREAALRREFTHS